MIVRPDYKAKTVFEINYDKLKEDGIKTIAFDLDSTVMKSKSGVFAEETLQLFDNLKKDFSIVIISNNSNLDYINKVITQADIPMLFHAKKPLTKVAKEFLNENNVDKKSMVMIGDRPLTDILFGKLLGCKTVLVDSISWQEEKPIVRFARNLERVFSI